MPSPSFEYHPEAIQEAHAAFHWYASHSQAVADRFWEELVRARSAIVAQPQAWMPYYHGTRAIRLWRFPYGLVYTVDGDRIIALAVCHFQRRPGYWRERIQAVNDPQGEG